MKPILASAAGGAMGRGEPALRRGLRAQVDGQRFSLRHALCQRVGSFLMGALVELMALKWNVSNELRAVMT